ncbi:hypothetical protein [Streptacidiphilus fuscans]|uniref:Uncharacterized protein n=1 Tax=Streptacidiphilus fuscans TaxID=2789292 RepID=A0A931BI91_9ACTN|nr:hypothetical protein [Streptacidiphilus fuscans]MBF9073935.1 hypothetical protein [Streptacidiphilus fuscans]
MGVDRVKLGTVEHQESAVFSEQTWTFAQHGLPPLTGTVQGISGRLRYGTPLGILNVGRLLDPGLGYRIAFHGPDSAGFEFARLKGLGSRYSLRIHDERISPMLALAAIIRYNRRMDLNPKAAAIEHFRLHSLD